MQVILYDSDCCDLHPAVCWHDTMIFVDQGDLHKKNGCLGHAWIHWTNIWWKSLKGTRLSKKNLITDRYCSILRPNPKLFQQNYFINMFVVRKMSLNDHTHLWVSHLSLKTDTYHTAWNWNDICRVTVGDTYWSDRTICKRFFEYNLHEIFF